MDASFKYFQSAVSKRDVGQKLALMYVEWANLTNQASEGGASAAIEVLQQGLKSMAEPRCMILEALSKLGGSETIAIAQPSPATNANSQDSNVLTGTESAVEVTVFKSDSLKSDESSSDDGVTATVQMQMPQPPPPPTQSISSACLPDSGLLADRALRSRVNTLSVATTSIKPPTATATATARTSRPAPAVGLLAVGKCQRIVRGANLGAIVVEDDMAETAARPEVKEETVDAKSTASVSEEGDFDGDISMMTATVKLDMQSYNRPSKKVADLSKYVDEKLLKFDPLARRGAKPVAAPSNRAAAISVISSEPKTGQHGAEYNTGKYAQQRLAPPSVVPGTTTLMNTTLSSVESDAETAPVDLSLSEAPIMESIQRPVILQPAPSENVEVGHVAENDEKGAKTKQRKRVSFAQAGGGFESGAKGGVIQGGNHGSQGHSVEAGGAKKSKGGQPDDSREDPSSALTQGNFAKMKHLVLNNRNYARLGVLGKGGSSCVHRVVNEAGQLFAYKRVDVRGSEESEEIIDSYVNEIDLLRRLKGSPYIIELVDAEVNREEMYIAMVMEVGEIDLSKVLSQRQRKASDGGGSSELNPFFIRLVWQEMLEAVDHIHENRIVHGDLKPANFVFVKGHLKLIDFGIAKAFSNDTTNIYRESQIGTVNYMAPESIAPFTDPSARTEGSDKGMMRLGRPSDIWSLGCILFQIIYGRPPFAALNTVQKLHAIPNPKYEIAYPPHGDPDAVESIKACLIRDPRQRACIQGEKGLISHSFLSLNARPSPETKSDCLDGASALPYTLENIQPIVQAVMELQGPTAPSISESALSIKVWGLLNQLSSRTIITESKRPSGVSSGLAAKSPDQALKCSAPKIPSRQPLATLPESFANQLASQVANL